MFGRHPKSGCQNTSIVNTLKQIRMKVLLSFDEFQTPLVYREKIMKSTKFIKIPLLVSAGVTAVMCLKRDNDDNCDKFLYPFPIMDTIDLTIDELEDDDDFVEITPPRDDQWDYPYNLLLSSDEEEPARGPISHMEDSNGDVHYAHTSTTDDSSNEINQNANTSSTSVNINFNISETNNTDQFSEDREFELNIPQILLSMSRISHNLYNQSSSSHD